MIPSCVFCSSAHLFRHPVVHGSQHWMECSYSMGNMTWIRKQAWPWTIPSSQQHISYLSQTMQSLTRGIIRISLVLTHPNYKGCRPAHSRCLHGLLSFQKISLSYILNKKCVRGRRKEVHKGEVWWLVWSPHQEIGTAASCPNPRGTRLWR